MVDKTPDPTLVARVTPLLLKLADAQRALSVARQAEDAAYFGLRRLLPDHDFTNESCPKSPGFVGHIYPPSVYRNVGNRNCVLCGRDDWSE